MARSWTRFRNAGGDVTPVTLTTTEADLIRQPVEGEGGFQGLMRDLQTRLRPDGTIRLDGKMIRRIREGMSHADGAGGFQGRLRGAFARSIGG